MSADTTKKTPKSDFELSTAKSKIFMAKFWADEVERTQFALAQANIKAAYAIAKAKLCRDIAKATKMDQAVFAAKFTSSPREEAAN